MPAIGIPLLFPILQDEDDFEDLCRDLLRTYWKRPSLERFGRKGQRQYGIDILDLGGISPLHAAQCKLREYGAVLSPAAISAEVGEARKFRPALGKYGILTTAKISAQAQTRILEINQAHRQEGAFEVELLAWNKLCELLQLNDEVRKTYYGSIVITPTSRVGLRLIPSANELSLRVPENSGSAMSAQIDEARDALRRHDFQIALLLLNRILESSSAGSLTDFEHFRISSNLGFVEAGLGRPEIAARHFLDALRWTPENQDARVNEVYAYILMGDTQTAHAKAEALRTAYSESTKLVSFWVMSAPRSTASSVLEARLNDTEMADADVALALSRRALGEFDISRALRYAQTAATAAPSASRPQLVIAQAEFGRLVGVGKTLGSPLIPRAELEARIEEALTEALRLAEAEHDERNQLEVLLLRSNFRLIQKRIDDAETDAMEARRIDPDNVQVLIALSKIRSKASDIDGAIKLLERAHRISPLADVEYMYACALLRRGTALDLDLAIGLLSALELPSLPAPMKAVIATLAVQAMVRKGKRGLAAAYLEPLAAELEATIRESLRGYIAQSEGDRDRALEFAKHAQAEMTSETAPETKEFLARVFMMADQPDDALPLYTELFQLDYDSFDAGQLLNCAARLHRDDIVISTCATLQERGMDEWAVVSFEVQYLQKYSRERAIERLDQFLAKHPEHRLARLTRSITGVQCQRPDLVNGKVADLPPVEDLPLDYILPVVHVLRFSGAGNEGVDYVYRYLRIHFDDIRAHQALILAEMPGDASVDIPPTLDVVQVGAAVSVQEELTGSIRWFVLEDTAIPNPQFEELPMTSSLTAELLNKHVGETVVVAKGHMGDRIGTIRQIMPKYVRRYQDCMTEMQIRFGNASSIESVHVGTSEADVRKNFEKIIESIKQRATAFSEVRRLYDDHPISLHMFGERFGKNAFVGLMNLAQAEGQTVKCSNGTFEERSEAISALQTSASLVVDITALATIRMIRLEDVLTEKRFHLQMTEGTWNELQETLSADLMDNVTGGTISYENGGPRFTRETAEQKAARQDQDQNFLDRIKQSIQVVPVIDLASLEPARRESLEKMFGQYGAESMMLASISDSVLWTDDLIQAQIAANEFGVKRAWTQLVVEQLAQSGEIAEAERDRVTAALVGLEYINTIFDSHSLLRAVEMSEATPWRWPLKQFVDVFQKPSPDFRVLVGIFADFLSRLYREPYLAESRCKVATAFLDAFWGNVSVRTGLLRLRRASSRLFVLNPVGQAQFDRCFDEWYRGRPDKLITPGGD